VIDSVAIRTGDTLNRVAARFGLKLAELLDLNPQIDDPMLIFPGQVVIVPRLGDGPPPVAKPVKSKIPWLSIAEVEMHTGVDEVSGGLSHNPRIVEYHRTTTLRATSDETPWCSSFVNWCIEQSGIKGTKSALARSWLNWGDTVAKPARGAVVVFKRGTDKRKGHVAFFWEKRSARVLVLGGNQDNQVSIKSYPKNDVLGFRWPEGLLP